MRKKKSSGSSKSLPLSTPTARPITKKELENLTTIRGYGIADLKKYLLKIKKNIGVFEEAIAKEKKEMARIKAMIAVLEADIKTADKLKKLIQ